jgi:hypothetical protein
MEELLAEMEALLKAALESPTRSLLEKLQLLVQRMKELCEPQPMSYFT